MNMRLFDLDETCMLVCLEGISMSEMYMLKSVDERTPHLEKSVLNLRCVVFIGLVYSEVYYHSKQNKKYLCWE